MAKNYGSLVCTKLSWKCEVVVILKLASLEELKQKQKVIASNTLLP